MKKLMTVILLLSASVVLAAENAVETETTGQGSTRQLAIDNALYLAVCKVQGVEVASSVARVNVRTGSLDVIRDPITGSKKIDIDDISASTAGVLSLVEARGLIKTFEILDEKQISPDVYQVKMKVMVYDYQSPEDTKKIRLAIFPLESTAAAHRFGDKTVSGARLGEQFSQYLNTMLARNEKFTVLDRNSQAAILKEKQILVSDDAPLEEKVRLGEVLGADYMLIGSIPQAEILVQESANPIIGGTTREFKAYMEVEYRLIVGPTRQVAVSDQLRIKLEDQQVKSLVEKWESDDIDYGQMQQGLVMRAAGQMADMITDYLYPVRVAAVRDSGTLILNQGGKRFAQGDTLEIFRTGGEIIDPETGKSLGKDESLVASAKIVKILPRISYAEVIGGSGLEITTGALCRRVGTDTAVQQQINRPSQIQETPSGGVKLPFDDRGQTRIIRKK